MSPYLVFIEKIGAFYLYFIGMSNALLEIQMNTLLINNNWNSLLDDVFSLHEEDYYVKNYKEDSNGYEYQLNLAGFKKENVKLVVDNNLIKVTAKQEDKEYFKNYSIPRKGDPTSVDANLEDGMLYIKINKKESAKSREVVIN